MLRNHTRRFLTPLLGLLLLTGCSSPSQTFEGFSTDEVWTAMVDAAENPSGYDEWSVVKSSVAADPETQRVHIYREVRRDLVLERTDPRRENKTIEQEVQLSETDLGEPRVTFKSRHLDVPAKARLAADQYFADVWNNLGGPPMRTEEYDDNDDDMMDDLMRDDEAMEDEAREEVRNRVRDEVPSGGPDIYEVD